MVPRAAYPVVVGAEQREHAARRHREAAHYLMQGKQVIRGTVDADPAKVRQDPGRHPRGRDGRDRRGRQRQLVPGDGPHPGHGQARGRRRLSLRPCPGRRGRRRPPRPQDPGGPDQAGEEEGKGADHLHERIADDRQGYQDPGADRDVPAGPGPVEQQQEQEHGHPGADVVRAAEQDLGRPGRLRRQDHPGRYQRSYRPLGPPRTAAGDEGGEQHEQRIGQRGDDMDHFRAQPGEGRHTHVRGQLSCVERDVRGPPAVQQQVAVQDVPGLKHHPRAVGVHLGGAGDAHVAEHQHSRGQQRARRPTARSPGRARPPLTPAASASRRSSPPRRESYPKADRGQAS